MPDAWAVRIQDLCVQAGPKQVLKDVSIDIPRNKVTAILGPSGCGKTTLLRCLNRLTDIFPELRVDGSVQVDGTEIFDATTDLLAVRQKMGMLSQRPYPLPMSIFENVAYGLRLKGEKNTAMLRAVVEENLRTVALWDEVHDRLKSPATRLSIGQQQRLCLARGLAVRPTIILADEPTSALDPVSGRVIEELFLARKSQLTTIVVTHILRQAKRLADYVVFMYYGEVIEQGSPSELFESPKTDTLKEYLRVGH